MSKCLHSNGINFVESKVSNYSVKREFWKRVLLPSTPQSIIRKKWMYQQ